MSYGISVTNTENKVQIDQDYVNYVLVASSSFYLTYDSNTYGVDTGTVAVSNYTADPDDLIFVNTGHENNLVNCVPSGSGYAWTAWPNGASGTVQVRIYRKMSKFRDSLAVPALPADRGYGLEVFAPSGISYSSYYRPMVLRAIIQGDPGFEATYTVSGYTPFVSCNTAFVVSANAPADGSFPGETTFQMVSADSTKAYAREAVAEGASGSSFDYIYSGIVSVLVIEG